jgi:hypothetical protein
MRRDVELSVVIAASCSAEAVARTVASVIAAGGLEIIVASDPDRVPPGPLPGRALWLIGEPGDGVPRLRAIGAGATRGVVVAFLEDACVVDRGWARAIRHAFRNRDVLATTGPVNQQSGGSTTDWAVYFAEYAGFAETSETPLPRRAWERGKDALAGINFACRREALGQVQTIREFELSMRLAGAILRHERASVQHTRRYRFGEALADRWRFGRAFGRERWAGHPGRLRSLGLAAAPAILGVQLARLIGTVATHPQLIGPLLRSAPTTLALLTAWSVGEALGWAESPGCGRAARPPSSMLVPGPKTRSGYTRGRGAA